MFINQFVTGSYLLSPKISATGPKHKKSFSIDTQFLNEFKQDLRSQQNLFTGRAYDQMRKSMNLQGRIEANKSTLKEKSERWNNKQYSSEIAHIQNQINTLENQILLTLGKYNLEQQQSMQLKHKIDIIRKELSIYKNGIIDAKRQQQHISSQQHKTIKQNQELNNLVEVNQQNIQKLQMNKQKKDVQFSKKFQLMQVQLKKITVQNTKEIQNQAQPEDL